MQFWLNRETRTTRKYTVVEARAAWARALKINLGTAETIIHSLELELGNFLKLFDDYPSLGGYLDTQLYPFRLRFLLLLLLYNSQVFQDTLRLFNRKRFSPSFWNERFTSKWNVLKSYSHFLHWSVENFSTRRDAFYSSRLSLKKILPFRKRSSNADLAEIVLSRFCKSSNFQNFID